jgi:hypothetical protein
MSLAYVSCIDAFGNTQTADNNLMVPFRVITSDNNAINVYDSYDDMIHLPGYSISITGNAVYYCVDNNGSCLPNTAYSGPISIINSGVNHLRYVGNSDPRIIDSTVLINHPPIIGDINFHDIAGKHAFKVYASVHDSESGPENLRIGANISSDINCMMNYSMHNVIRTTGMNVTDGIASATIQDNLGYDGSVVALNVSCSDGISSVKSAATHQLPNIAPFINNIPDISLTANSFDMIDVSFLANDLEGDSMYYYLTDAGSGLVKAQIIGNKLIINSYDSLGSTPVCVGVNDTYGTYTAGAVNNSMCFNVYVENSKESKLKNNEFTNTKINLFAKVE